MIDYYKFNKEANVTIEQLKDSKIYKAIEEAEKGNKKLLKEMFIYCSFGVDHLLKGYYLLQGFKFFTSQYCKKYLIKYKYDDVYREYYAPDKTSLYNAIGGRHKIISIYEVKGANIYE